MEEAIGENSESPLQRPVKNETVSVRVKVKSKGNTGTGNPGKNVDARIGGMSLAKQPKLTIRDVTCPICWSILYEPTTLPCNHSLCMACYLKHAEETSLYCPCCRRRLSIWSRKAKKQNELLDKDLWTRLKNEFPELIAARDDDDLDQDFLTEDDSLSQPSVRDGVICDTPGAIFDELKQVMKPHEEDLEKERLEAELASINLIKKLEDEEHQVLANYNKTEQEDFLLAKRLQEEFYENTKKESMKKNSESMKRKSERMKTPCKKLANDFHIDKPAIKSNPQDCRKSLPAKKQNTTKSERVCRKGSIINSDSVILVPIDKQEAKINQDPPTEAEAKTSKSDCSTTPFADFIPEERVSDDTNRHIVVNIKADKIQGHVQIIPETAANPLLHPNSEIPPTLSEKFNPVNLPSDDEIIPPSDSEDEGHSSRTNFDFFRDERFHLMSEDEDDGIIDYELITKEANEWAVFRLKLDQEAEDKAFAATLQRNFNLGIDESRGKESEHKYSIRAWKRTRTSQNELT